MKFEKKTKKSPNMGNIHATRIFPKFCNFFYRVTSSFCHIVSRQEKAEKHEKKSEEEKKKKKERRERATTTTTARMYKG